jgi:hypothetical protein
VTDRVRVLAFGVLPNGEGYWISARRSAPEGKASVDLTADLEPPTGSREAINEAFGSAGGGTLRPNFAHGPLALGVLVACADEPVTLLLGLLRAPSDAAVLRYGGRSHAMTRVIISHDLGTDAELVYGYSSRRAKVVVRSGSGAVVETVAIPGTQAGSTCVTRSAG